MRKGIFTPLQNLLKRIISAAITQQIYGLIKMSIFPIFLQRNYHLIPLNPIRNAFRFIGK